MYSQLVNYILTMSALIQLLAVVVIANASKIILYTTNGISTTYSRSQAIQPA